ncbi:MAG: endopeptidase [Burkholderiaceae bacterium]
MRNPLDPDETDEVAALAQAALKRKQQVEDFKWLMAHAQGRRIVSRVLAEAGVHRTTFNHSGSVMAFNEGKRHIGLFLLAEILEIAPESYTKLLKEYRIE